MPTIDEKRVFDDRTGASTLYLATDVGLVRVVVADDRVGEYGVVRPGTVRDLAFVGGRFVVADGESVTVDDEPTGLGRARAVGSDATDAVLVVLDDGAVRRLAGPPLGTARETRAVDGGLLATPDGVWRATGDDLRPAGLSDVRDVVRPGTESPPLAATAAGLYALGPGWDRRVEGEFVAVARGPETAVALSAGGEVHRGAAGAWTRLPDPPGSLEAVDVARGPETTYVAGRGGRLAVRVDDGEHGWRTRALGTPGVSRLTARPEPKGERAGPGSDET